MAIKAKKTCILCGKEYDYCPSCPSKYNVTETWRNIFCSENCRDIYHVYDFYNAGRLEEKEAVKFISKFDTSKISDMKEPMKSVLILLLNLNKKPKKDSIKKEESKKEDVKEVAKEKEVVSEKKVTTPKKRSYRKKNSEVG